MLAERRLLSEESFFGKYLINTRIERTAQNESNHLFECYVRNKLYAHELDQRITSVLKERIKSQISKKTTDSKIRYQNPFGSTISQNMSQIASQLKKHF